MARYLTTTKNVKTASRRNARKRLEGTLGTINYKQERKSHYTLDVFKCGSNKYGYDTMIFSQGAATDCPSRKAGLCGIVNQSHECYRVALEVFLTHLKAYGRRQQKYWEETTLRQLEGDIRAAKAHFERITGVKITYFRINEGSDFNNACDLEKWDAIAMEFSSIKFAAYTANPYILQGFRPIAHNLTVRASNFDAELEFKSMLEKDIPQGEFICCGDCTICKACFYPDTKRIYNALRHRRNKK